MTLCSSTARGGTPAVGLSYLTLQLSPPSSRTIALRTSRGVGFDKPSEMRRSNAAMPPGSLTGSASPAGAPAIWRRSRETTSAMRVSVTRNEPIGRLRK
jgi:hypothetical protein